jgi:integrase
MAQQKRARLPRGLHWDGKSPFIFFNWRDALGKQHHQSTGTTGPQEALLFKLKFLAEREENLEETEADAAEDLGRLPLSKVCEMYFGWKTAKSSAATIERERRIFKPVLKWLGSAKVVKAINLVHLRQYQQQRRKHVSNVMKQPVTARTVNYELDLLRGVMKYAGRWTPELDTHYEPLPELKSKVGKAATIQQLARIIKTAKTNESWGVALYAAAVAIGTGCRGGEIRTLQLRDIHLKTRHIVIRRESAKNRSERHPRLTAVGEWGLRNLLERARGLGASEPEHYLLPLSMRKSRILSKVTDQKWDVTKPMVTWVKSWRKLMEACGMPGFRFHDLRHTFRTLGAQAGVPLEVMMAQVGHMDRQTSLEYVHIQQNALERAQRLIDREQAAVLRATASRVPRPRRRNAQPLRLPERVLLHQQDDVSLPKRDLTT